MNDYDLRLTPCGAYNHFELDARMEGCPHCKDRRAMMEAQQAMSETSNLMKFFDNNFSTTPKIGQPVVVPRPIRTA